MTYFVDTGLLLRAIDRSDANYPTITACFRMLRARHELLATSTQNIREFWNISTRPISARAGYARTIAKTAQCVRIFERFIRILTENPDSYARWRQLVENVGVSGVQVHDANLVAIMESYGIKQLVTLNPSDFRRYPQIQALTPSQLLTQVIPPPPAGS